MDCLKLKDKFTEVFGKGNEGRIRVFTAPGRVNLIGEHTDYNGGYVFPAAISMGTIALAAPRNDRKIRIYANDLNLLVEGSLDDLQSGRGLNWGNYQLGVADELMKAGYTLVGCDMLFDMDLPPKSGLSSSASIEVATAVALVTLGNERSANAEGEIDMAELAQICQRAEHNYIGVKCGIMDQFASAMGKKGHAILLNCKTLDYKYVPLNMPGYALVISNTNCKRSLASSAYNERRNQCEAGLEQLKESLPFASCLGDISPEQYEENKDLITDPTVRKRVEFVIGENRRVLKSVEALERNDLDAFGRIITEAHEAIARLYEVTCVELDTLVDEALKIKGVLGSRMTGAGFGGCTVSIVPEEKTAEFVSVVGENYTRRTGLKADFYVCCTEDGGRELDFI